MKLDSVIAKANHGETRDLPLWDDFVIKVRVPHFHDLAFLRATFNAQKPAKDETQEAAFKREIQQRVLVGITGWSGLADDDGNPIPFTQDNAVALFSRDDMLGWANRFLIFFNRLQAEVIETTDWAAGYPTEGGVDAEKK